MSDATTGRPVIKVFLLDDHEIVRRGVRELLETEPDIEVIGEAGTAESALARIPALRPDVAVLDVRLPDGSGVAVCRDIRSKMPEVRCLMLTSFGDDEALFDAIMAGAAGYVLKQIRGTDLVGAVRTVASGESMLDPEAASRVMRRMREQAERSDPLAALTGQERKILELIGEGLTNRQIGEQLYLAEKTVKNYVSGLFTKLGMERRTQAAVYAARVFGDDQPRRATGGLYSGTRHSSAVPPSAAGSARMLPSSVGRPVGQVGQAAAAPARLDPGAVVLDRQHQVASAARAGNGHGDIRPGRVRMPGDVRQGLAQHGQQVRHDRHPRRPRPAGRPAAARARSRAARSSARPG